MNSISLRVAWGGIFGFAVFLANPVFSQEPANDAWIDFGSSVNGQVALIDGRTNVIDRLSEMFSDNLEMYGECYIFGMSALSDHRSGGRMTSNQTVFIMGKISLDATLRFSARNASLWNSGALQDYIDAASGECSNELYGIMVCGASCMNFVTGNNLIE